MVFFESRGFFQNRLYFAHTNVQNIKSIVKKEGKNELKGAGFRSYSNIFGKILSFFGLTFKLKVNNSFFYANYKSFAKYLIRGKQVLSKKELSLKTQASKMHELYLSQKNSNLNSTKDVVKELKKIHSEKVVEFEERDLEGIYRILYKKITV